MYNIHFNRKTGFLIKLELLFLFFAQPACPVIAKNSEYGPLKSETIYSLTQAFENLRGEKDGSISKFGLALNISPHLNAAQVETFSEGFSIYSKLTLKPLEAQVTEPLYSKECVFVFDGWNDRYKVSDIRQENIFYIKDKKELFEKCFQLEVTYDTLTTLSGKAEIKISVDPLSYETAEEMKNWIKNAQPGPLKPIIKYLFRDNSMVYEISKEVEIKNLYNIYNDLLKTSKQPSVSKKPKQLPAKVPL